MILSRDKSVKLAYLYSRVGWLEKYNASLGLRLNEASTQASKMEARARGLELELTRANGERNAQRATAEQKAKEAELQVAALRENVEALAARAARSQHQEATIKALTDTLVQKDALLEAHGDALRSVETALEERGSSVSVLLQQVDTVRAELDE